MEIQRGTLSSGRGWHLVRSRRKHPGLKTGEHHILECVDQATWHALTLSERGELLAIAYDRAEKLALVFDRWQVGFNGPGLAHRSHFHVHILLPSESDVRESFSFIGRRTDMFPTGDGAGI